MPSPRGSSQPRDQTQVSCITGRVFTIQPPGKPKNTGVDSLYLLQGNFPVLGVQLACCELTGLPLPGLIPTQESNPGVLHCRQILYQLSYQRSPGGCSGKESQSTANAGDRGDPGSIPESGRTSREGKSNPLQYSCLGNPMDRGALWAIQSMGLQRIRHN